jgi:hypothetical protein
LPTARAGAHERGWTIDEYVDWAVETFDSMLLR